MPSHTLYCAWFLGFHCFLVRKFFILLHNLTMDYQQHLLTFNYFGRARGERHFKNFLLYGFLYYLFFETNYIADFITARTSDGVVRQ
jgi:hypothetical protein